MADSLPLCGPQDEPDGHPVTQTSGADCGIPSWLGPAARLLVPSAVSPDRSHLRLVSSALPTPTPSAHIFGRLISSLAQFPSNPLPWLHVTHVVPPSFYLSDLSDLTFAAGRPKPSSTSPSSFSSPSTPYSGTSLRRFDVAVPVDSAAAPPESIHVAIVERYIPPPSGAEPASLFEPNGRSVLANRLTELSSDGGLALFIYPTRTGGRAFMRSHLSPCLDPLLRSLAVVHGFPPDLTALLGNMAAVEALVEYDEMEMGVHRLCAALSEPPAPEFLTRSGTDDDGDESSASHLPATAAKTGNYAVVTGYRAHVSIDSTLWPAQWWGPQEQDRLRRQIRAHMASFCSWQRRGSYGSSSSTTTPSPSPMSGISGMSTNPADITASLYAAGSQQSGWAHRAPHHRLEPNITPTTLTHEIINGLNSRIRARVQSGALSPSVTSPVSTSSHHSSASSGRRPMPVPDETIEVGVFLVRKSAVK